MIERKFYLERLIHYMWNGEVKGMVGCRKITIAKNGGMRFMKRLRCVLMVVLILSILAGNGSIQMEKTVSAATKSNTFTLKAAPDFTLKLPKNWKGNYIVKSSKKMKAGSYVSFYSQKCYKKTKEGHLFTIMRFKDNSYMELPSYELVGEWNGFKYVALYPTDVQFLGAGKTAQSQYTKLNRSSEKIARSIRPTK